MEKSERQGQFASTSLLKGGAWSLQRSVVQKYVTHVHLQRLQQCLYSVPPCLKRKDCTNRDEDKLSVKVEPLIEVCSYMIHLVLPCMLLRFHFCTFGAT